jgi:hypothetical protein
VAGRGPAPKRPEERLDQRRREPTRELPAAAKVRRPRLPRGQSEETKRWWKTWCESPQAALFEDTDWQRLLDLVPLKEAYYGGKLSLQAEIRRNEASLGAPWARRGQRELEARGE